MTSDYGASYIPAKNCIHMLLGDEMFRLIEEAGPFFAIHGDVSAETANAQAKTQAKMTQAKMTCEQAKNAIP